MPSSSIAGCSIPANEPDGRSEYDSPIDERFAAACAAQGADAASADLVDAAGAGWYLPEYRATLGRAGSFIALCTNPQLACEVTLQPIDRFPLDAAILFSDILTIPHAMNLGLEFEAGEGPTIERPVRSAADVANLRVPDPAHELRYVIDAVALIRRELAGRRALLRFFVGPPTAGRPPGSR